MVNVGVYTIHGSYGILYSHTINCISPQNSHLFLYSHNISPTEFFGKWTCPLKRDHCKRNFILQPSISGGYVSFQDVYSWKVNNKQTNKKIRTVAPITSLSNSMHISSRRLSLILFVALNSRQTWGKNSCFPLEFVKVKGKHIRRELQRLDG